MGPSQEGFSILLIERPSAAHGSFLMQGDAAKENGLAVQQNLGAVSFDGAEADVIANFVSACRESNLINPGAARRPQLQLGGEMKFGATAGIGGWRNAYFPPPRFPCGLGGWSRDVPDAPA